MSQQSSLPEAWVDRIFQKLALTYGRTFLNRWEGMDINAVKEDWGHELRGFQQSPDAIKHALEHLPPDKAPTVLEFRDLCLKAPKYAAKALPAPKPDPAVVREVMGAINKPTSDYDRLGWAKRLLGRVAGGEKLPKAHIDMAKRAIGGEA